jgi:hypothetical protein
MYRSWIRRTTAPGFPAVLNTAPRGGVGAASHPPTIAGFVKGCLFYRIYAIPYSGRVFEKFSCPQWEHRVDANIRLEIANETFEQNVTLHPGLTHTWKNFSFTTLAISQAPAPVLSNHFLTDGVEVALADEFETDLTCADKELAAGFNCTLSPKSCVDCVPDPDSPQVTCACRQVTCENLFIDLEKRLPLHMSMINLRHRGSHVFAETVYAPVQVNVKTNVQLITQAQHTRCEIKPINITGCYRCHTGSNFRSLAKLNMIPRWRK